MGTAEDGDTTQVPEEIEESQREIHYSPDFELFFGDHNQGLPLVWTLITTAVPVQKLIRSCGGMAAVETDMALILRLIFFKNEGFDNCLLDDGTITLFFVKDKDFILRGVLVKCVDDKWVITTVRIRGNHEYQYSVPEGFRVVFYAR